MRVEQPRGEVAYYVKANGTKILSALPRPHAHLREHPGHCSRCSRAARLADVPTIVLTIDPCISCTER